MKVANTKSIGCSSEKSQKRKQTIWHLSAMPAMILMTLLAGCGKSTQSPQQAAPEVKKAEEARSASIDYSALDFAKLNDAQQAASEMVKGLKGDEFAVAQAWAATLKNLAKAKSEVERTGKALIDADILNVSTITNGTQSEISDQFVMRRGIANANSSAINDWQNALHRFSGAYQGALIERSVPMERVQSESKKMTQALVDKLKTEADLCEAEKKVPQEYNYAVNAMQNYYIYRSAYISNNTKPQGAYAVPTRDLPWETKNTPSPIVTDASRKFEKEVAKVEELKKAAFEARQASGLPN